MADKTVKQIRNVLVCMCVVMFLAVCRATSSVSIDILLAVFIFLIFSPLVNSLERMHVHKVVSTLIVVVLIVIVILSFTLFVFYSIDQLAVKLPAYSVRVFEVDNMLTTFIRRWVDLPEEYSFIGALNIDWISVVLMPVIRRISSSAIDIVSNAFVVILMAVFLLLERHSFAIKIENVLKSENRSKFIDITHRTNEQISKYMLIKLLISIATGFLFYITARFTKLDFALIVGVLTVIMNFIPTLGSIIITAVTILLAVLQFLPDWNPVLIVAACTISTQMILGNILEPMFQGNSLNISPFVILISLSIFGYVWGIVGMFLAVPLLSILQILFSNVESTRSIAILMSSGFSLKRVMKRAKKKKTGNQNSVVPDDYDYDFS